jgi:hypothetical protein
LAARNCDDDKDNEKYEAEVAFGMAMTARIAHLLELRAIVEKQTNAVI